VITLKSYGLFISRLAPQLHAAMETFCMCAKKGSTLKFGWRIWRYNLCWAL